MSCVVKRTWMGIGLLWLLCSGLPGVLADSTTPVRVVLHKEAQVTAPEITLGDLAKVEAPEPLAEKLRQIPIAQAPLPGKRRLIHAPHIRFRLMQSKLVPLSQVTIVGNQVSVRREISSLLSPAQILQQAQAYLRQQGGEPTLQLEAVNPIQPMSLFPGASLVFQRLSRPSEQGPITLEARLMRGNQPLARQILIVRPGKSRKGQVFARRNLPAHHLLTEEDVIFQGETVEKSSILGKRLLRAVRAGEAIHPTRDLASTWLVTQGEIVTLTVQIGNLRASTQARALQAGMYGQIIRVLNLQSGREQHGAVIGPRQVLLNPQADK